jgi:outer membrane protein, heavy metal efflux system
MSRNYVSMLSVGLALLALGARSPGAETSPLTLDEAVQIAQSRAPQLDAQQAAVDSATSLVMSAGRLPDPQLVIGVDNLPVTGPDAGSFTADFMTMRKIGVMQSFPREEKRRLQHVRAQAEVDRASAELVANRLEVAREATEAWIRLATAHSAFEQLSALEPEIELGATAARAQLASGRASSVDALTAEAAVARLKNRLAGLQAEAQKAQAQLARWIGEDANRVPSALPAFDQLPIPPETLLTTAHQHGMILPFEARLAEARADVDSARAARRPDWSTELSFAKRGSTFSDMVSLQFTVDLPVFARTRQDPVIAARSADLRRIEAERDTQVRMHTAELHEVLIDWRQLGEQLTRYDQELSPLARERSRAALAAYRAGSADLRGALDAFSDEIEILIERAGVEEERGRMWAFLRYLEPQHLHPRGSP